MAKATKEKEEKEFDIDKKVVVKNIASWGAAFNKIESFGSVDIAPEGKTKLSRSEILQQIQNGNRLFTGMDGMGSHSTLFIDDAATRAEAGFDDPESGRKQLVLSDEIVREVFEIDDQKAFEKRFKEVVVTRAEKCSVIQIINRLGINDYRKINFAQAYTGFKLQ